MVKVNLKKRKNPYITLKAYLHSRKISYRKAAPVLGMSLGTFCSKINGQSDFTIQDIKKLASEFDFDPGIIFDLELRRGISLTLPRVLKVTKFYSLMELNMWLTREFNFNSDNPLKELLEDYISLKGFLYEVYNLLDKWKQPRNLEDTLKA